MNERALFDAALGISDPAARQAFLDQACAGQPQLRARLDALLESHAAAGDFLATPATAIDGPATGNIEADKTVGYAAAASPDEPAVTLGFLTPSTKPGSLGRLDHYEVEEVLGHGAFGIVLKAFDEKLHRKVAIKVLAPELAATSPPRKRFLREARAAAAIRHENVVAVHDVAEAPLPYLVMEYIPGITLERALQDHGPLDADDVLRLGQQIACGLAAAHAQGLIHRDIKPSNILLENGLTGKVKITDFGLARAADDASLTQSGIIAGTPMYMSPEQAQSGKIDQRSDLFSLGSVLYAMLSGRPPFRAANTLAVLKRVVEDTPRPIGEIIADTPDWLCAIIAKLQAKKPEDRFATAQEVAELLGRCLADLLANRPVALPADMRSAVAEEESVVAAERVAPLSASETATRRVASRRVGPTIAALALVAFIGLGVTEATGVTQLTSTVIRLTTGSGTLVIETDDPSVKVTIDGEEVSIQGAGVEQLTLKPGQYKVAAVKDGAAVSQQLVTITRGGKQVVRVTMEGIDNQRVSTKALDGKKLAFLLPGFDEWIGTVQKLPADKQLQAVANRLQELNPGFDGRLTNFAGNGEPSVINDAVVDLWVSSDKVFDLSPIRAFSELRTFACGGSLEAPSLLSDLSPLEGTSISVLAIDNANVRDLSPLRRMPLKAVSLRHVPVIDLTPLADTSISLLACRDVPITDLSPLKGKDFGNLHLEDVPVRDISTLAGMRVAWLKLDRAEVSDFSPLRRVRGLELLSVAGAKNFGDPELEELISQERLTYAGLTNTQVTAAGVKQLAAALPQCRIEWDGGVIEPTMTDDPDRATAEWVLSVGGQVEVVAGEKRVMVEAGQELPPGPLQLVFVSLNFAPLGNRALADAERARLKGLRHLQRIYLRHAQVSDADLASLRDSRDLELLYCHGAAGVTDAGIAALQQFPRLSELTLNGAQVTGVGVKPLRNLKGLSLTSTIFTDEGIAAVAGLTQLENLFLKIDIAGNPSRETLDGCLVPLSRLTRLKYLQTPQRVTKQGLEVLRQFPDLETLSLNGAILADDGLAVLHGVKKLTRVDLCFTQVTQAGIEKLAADLPRCHIRWDGGEIEPRQTQDETTPSPLDALDPSRIPVAERFDWQPKELVAVFGSHAHRHWGRDFPPGYCLAVSPDGAVLATGGGDCVIRLWDADSLQLLGTLDGLTWPPNSLRFSPDGKRLLSAEIGAGQRETIHLWNVITRKKVKDYTALVGDSAYTGFPYFGPDGKPMAALTDWGGLSGKVVLYDLEARKVLQELSGHAEKSILLVDVHPAGTQIATSDADAVRLWDAATGALLHQWAETPGPEARVRFSPDGKLLAAKLGQQPEAGFIIWNVETKAPVLKRTAIHTHYCMSLAFSPDGQQIVSGGHHAAAGPEHDFLITDIASGETVSRIPSPQFCKDSPYFEAVFCHDGARIATFGTHYGAGGDGVLRVYDAATGEPQAPLPAAPYGPTRFVAVAPDLQSIFSIGGDGVARLWSLEPGVEPTSFDTQPYNTQRLNPAWFPDGERLLLLEQAVRLRDRHGEVLAELPQQPTSAAVLRDGKTVVSGQPNGFVEFYDFETQPPEKRRAFLAHEDDAGMNNHVLVAFSPDERRLLTAGEHRAKVWDLSGPEPALVHTLGQAGTAHALFNIYEATFAPDGGTVALARENRVEVWDVAAPEAALVQELFLDARRYIHAIAYDPTGAWLAAADVRGQVKVWNTHDWSTAFEWTFPGQVHDLQFAPDGRHLVTGNSNGTIYVLGLANERRSLAKASRAQPRDGWHGWPADAPKPAIAPFDAEQAKKHQEEWAKYLGVPVEYTNSIGMKFRLIPPGEFLMGATAEEIQAALAIAGNNKEWQLDLKSQTPQHRVRLTRPSYLGVHEVTQQQYKMLFPAHVSYSGGPVTAAKMDTANFPVDGVSWLAAAEFCASLSTRENFEPFYLRRGETLSPQRGTGYRLPTEAEWELACRAGSTTKYWFGEKDEGLPETGWFQANSDDRPHVVGTLRANPFGLFDVHGNLWEWTEDYFDSNVYAQSEGQMAIDPVISKSVAPKRTVRGGDFHDLIINCRAASRGGLDEDSPFASVGIRVALSVDGVRQALANQPLPADPDRAAAAWALSVGIPVEIAVGNEKRTVQPGSELPAEPFVLRYVELRNPAVTDAGLAHFAGCRNLVSLHLSGPAITDAGVVHFKDCKQLVQITVEKTSVTDAGLAHFAGCRELTHLVLGGSPVSDAGLAAFQHCRELRGLHLDQTRVTDAGLAHFRDCPQLEQIGLGYTKVTDAGLVHFRNCRELTNLNLIDTKVSDAGMENFRRCRELVQLTLDNTQVTDAGLANFRDCRRLTRLNLDGLGVTDAGLANFANCPELTELTLHGAKFTDAGLEPFAKCNKLVHLTLHETPLSDAGLAHFAGCVELQRIGLDRTNITDAGLAHLKNCAKLTQLNLRNTPIGDAGLALLQRCEHLDYLMLEGTKVTDAGLPELAGHPRLTELQLNRTAVTDAGLEALKTLKSLKLLGLRKTEVSSAGINALQAALPQCQIDW